MRYLTCLMLTVLVAACMHAAAIAGDNASGNVAAGGNQAASQSGKGTISNLDVAANSLSVRMTDAKGKTIQTLILHVSATTTITRDGAAATLATLKLGDDATVTYVSADATTNNAVTITASKPKAKGKGKTKPKK